ncbi:hypothetical protein MMC12_004234 [Toensbergia leucococca]|nr:hypothetical protein [Toensbergia leucococca]
MAWDLLAKHRNIQDPWPTRMLEGIQIMSVCRQIYHESQPVFYSRNTFSAPRGLNPLTNFLKDRSPDALRNIQHLDLKIVLDPEYHRRYEPTWLEFSRFVSKNMQLKTLTIVLDKMLYFRDLRFFHKENMLKWIDTVTSIRGVETFRLLFSDLSWLSEKDKVRKRRLVKNLKEIMLKKGMK